MSLFGDVLVLSFDKHLQDYVWARTLDAEPTSQILTPSA